MAADLGTWRPAQADALVRVLAEDGIDASTERTEEGVRVTVPAGDAERASRVMSARMEEIAAAANGTRTVRAPRWYEDEADEEGPPLLMERFRQMGAVLGVLIAGLMVAFYVPGPFQIVAAIITFIVIGVMIARGRRREADDEDRTYGPGA